MIACVLNEMGRAAVPGKMYAKYLSTFVTRQRVAGSHVKVVALRIARKAGQPQDADCRHHGRLPICKPPIFAEFRITVAHGAYSKDDAI